MDTRLYSGQFRIYVKYTRSRAGAQQVLGLRSLFPPAENSVYYVCLLPPGALGAHRNVAIFINGNTYFLSNGAENTGGKTF